jgi:lysophospholipid acyltransferase
MLVWSRVYFYAIILTVVSTGLFASPAVKAYLRRQLDARAAKAGVVKKDGVERIPLSRTTSTDSVSRAPVLGLSADPERDVDEAISELREDIRLRVKAAKEEKKAE